MCISLIISEPKMVEEDSHRLSYFRILLTR